MSNSIYTAHNVRMLDWHGLRPLDAIECPRIALGSQCLSGTDELCLCERYSPRPLDHPRIWRDGNGRLVYTAEFYDLGSTPLSDLLQELLPLGATVSFSSWSPWNLGSTTLLKVTR